MSQSIVIWMRNTDHPKVVHLNQVETLVNQAHKKLCAFHGLNEYGNNYSYNNELVNRVVKLFLYI